MHTQKLAARAIVELLCNRSRLAPAGPTIIYPATVILESTLRQDSLWYVDGAINKSWSSQGILCLVMSAFRSSGVLKVDSGKGWMISFEQDILNDCVARGPKVKLTGPQDSSIGVEGLCDSGYRAVL
jgi:hypothetical protein